MTNLRGGLAPPCYPVNNRCPDFNFAINLKVYFSNVPVRLHQSPPLNSQIHKLVVLISRSANEYNGREGLLG